MIAGSELPSWAWRAIRGEQDRRSPAVPASGEPRARVDSAARRSKVVVLTRAIPGTPAAKPTRRRANTKRDLQACDYRIPLYQLRDEGSEGFSDPGCSCTAVCLAGQSARGDGRVGGECWTCALAGQSG